jgi:D-sedoheptulose 7-phosphate isomerase
MNAVESLTTRMHLAALATALRALERDAPRIDEWGHRLADVLLRGGRLLAAGNGGSAAEAQHLTGELVGRYRIERPPLSALALHADTSSLTAVGNDYGADETFARQVRAHGRPGDVLVALTTSGESTNIVMAVEAAREGGLTTWALTGARPNPVAALADETVAVDAPAPTVQEVHLVVVHLLCGAVDAAVETVLGEPRGDESMPREDAERVIAQVRASGGSVVATGGCFDLLHAGHVRTLQEARALGDCLVVCLNSDASVRSLKGSDRPLVAEDDRAAVLESLACVDAVVVFDERTPEAVLERLRPDIWAKGGDYEASELPEAKVLERWGGRVVILPYVEGRSTTRLLEEVRLRGVG